MRWDYRIISVHNVNEEKVEVINLAGKEGWELVAVDNRLAFFKRPSEPKPKQPYSYETVQDGYVIYGPDDCKINPWDLTKLLNEKLND